MPSPESAKFNQKLRKYKGAHADDLAAARAFVDDSGNFFTIPDSVTCTPVDVGGIPGEWLIPADATQNGVLYFLHGGAYVLGSIQSHRHMVAELADAAGLRALMIDYRLAPEHPFPAGLDDAVSGYQYLLEQGYKPNDIAIAGDSAGGGLTLSCLLKLRDLGIPLPACTMLLSPWTDLTNAVPSRATKAESDPTLTVPGAFENAARYMNGQDLAHPLASPLFADLTGLPPMLIQVGTEEILLDDSIQLADKATSCGVDAQLDVWEEQFHVWQYYVQKIPEANEAIDELAAYARSFIR